MDVREECRLAYFGIADEEDGHYGGVDGGVCHGCGGGMGEAGIASLSKSIHLCGRQAGTCL